MYTFFIEVSHIIVYFRSAILSFVWEYTIPHTAVALLLLVIAVFTALSVCYAYHSYYGHIISKMSPRIHSIGCIFIAIIACTLSERASSYIIQILMERTKLVKLTYC